MQALRSLFVVVMILGLAGCSSAKPPVMPEVTGKTLDVAKSDINRQVSVKTSKFLAAAFLVF